MSNMVAVLIVRCTHTGVYADGRPNLASVTLYDLDEITIQKNRTRAVPIPVGSTVDIPMSTRTFVSWHQGDIYQHTKQGILRSEIVFQLRDRENCGGPTGTGQTLRPAVLNIERVGNVLRLVLPDNTIPTVLETVGYMVGEPVEITGLTGGFRQLNGAYVISNATAATGLAGAAIGSYLIEVPSVGPDLAPATLVGVNVCLTEGRVTVQFGSDGNVGGFGSEVFGYIGGQLFPNTGGGGAPANAAYVVMAPSALTDERVLTAGAGIVITDGGPDSTVTISTAGATATAILSWGNSSVANSTATRYLDPGFESRIAPLAPIQIRVPRTGTLRNLYVQHNSPGGTGAIITYTVRVNGGVTALSASVASTSASGFDVVNSIVVFAGDLVDIEVTKVVVAGGGTLESEITVEMAS